MKKRARWNHTPAFKAKVALAGRKTIERLPACWTVPKHGCPANLQRRSGQPVHQFRIHQCADQQRHLITWMATAHGETTLCRALWRTIKYEEVYRGRAAGLSLSHEGGCFRCMRTA